MVFLMKKNAVSLLIFRCNTAAFYTMSNQFAFTGFFWPRGHDSKLESLQVFSYNPPFVFGLANIY